MSKKSGLRFPSSDWLNLLLAKGVTRLGKSGGNSNGRSTPVRWENSNPRVVHTLPIGKDVHYVVFRGSEFSRFKPYLSYGTKFITYLLSKTGYFNDSNAQSIRFLNSLGLVTPILPKKRKFSGKYNIKRTKFI